MVIRLEDASDTERAAIHGVNQAAFGRPEEADLVDALRHEGAVLLSVVAEVEGKVAGHILFTRMWIDTANGPVASVALAPMAVAPEHQHRGIGGQLVRHGLKRLRELGERSVIVVGHPSYYPRFGFSTELASGLENPFPRDTFLALELRPGALEGIRGKVRYAAAFGI